MSHLVNRSRRTQQRNRQSNRVNRNRSRRKIRNQRGGNDVQVSIYCNLTLSQSDPPVILDRKLTKSESTDVQGYVEETFKILKNPTDSTQNIVNMLTAITPDTYATIKQLPSPYNAITPDTYATIEQLPSPYDGPFYFVIELSMSETYVKQFLNQEIVNELISYMKHGTVNLDQGKDYSGNLLSNDKAIYCFDAKCKLVKP